MLDCSQGMKDTPSVTSVRTGDSSLREGAGALNHNKYPGRETESLPGGVTHIDMCLSDLLSC